MKLSSGFNFFGTIALMLALSACNSSDESGPLSVSKVRPVKLITVATAQNAQISQFPAVIGAKRLTELSFQVGGLLNEFPVTESQQLKRGDLIAKLDQRDLISAVDTATAQFKVAEADYKRGVRLAKEDAIAGNVLEQRKSQLDVTKAQLDQAKKALEDSVLLAPFEGVIAQKLVNKLESISPGTSVVTFMSVDSPEATIDLPARFLANIPKDETDSEHRQAFVILDAAPNLLVPAEFKEASLIADASSQTYAITFSFRPPNNLLVLPGMNATIEVRINNQHQDDAIRIAVPLDAISASGDSNYVWIVNEETMLVSKRAVILEDGVGSSIIVTSGLNEGDLIVGAGAAYLSEGMEVRKWQ
jgi:RND family efflux transporter MFP subunit